MALDTGSQTRFDTSYFANLRIGRGILQSDQALWNDPSTKSFVQRYLGGFKGLLFNVEFAKSMFCHQLAIVHVKINLYMA